MNKTIFACDIDNTLIYSKKHPHDGWPCVEWIHENEQAYMSPLTCELLSRLGEEILFLPVTSRSAEQYSRIRWPEGIHPRHVITTHGAVDVWVYGYIVGGDLSSSRCSFDGPFSSRTNIVLASKSSCRDKQSCLSVQLAKGDVRDALNLVDHPENLGRKIYLKGDIVASYYGIEGLQGVSEYMWK